ncbi:acyltransferase family protein [Corynebacterium sp. 335C]
MPKPIDAGTAYVPAIDGLRTIAVAAVVLYHLHVAWTPGGVLGVGVFFTLSGYLITANLLKARQRRGSLGLRTFWLRRFRRLVPAVVVTVLAVLLLIALLRPADLGAIGGESLSSLLYVNNWHVILTGDSYFDRFVAGPLDHMWSLSVEEQFYLVWPLVLALLLAVLGMRRKLLAPATLLLAAASFAWMAHLAAGGADPTRIHEGTGTRAGSLLAGAVLAVLLVRGGEIARPPRWLAELAGAAGVTGILAFVLLVPDQSPMLHRGGLALLALATVAAVAGALHPRSAVSRLLGVAPMRWIGERSYGIYLWHMPVTVFLADVTGALPAVLRASAVIAVSVLLAALSWALVEDPIRRHGVIGPARDWLRRRREARAGARAGEPDAPAPPGAPRPVLAGAALVAVAVACVGAPVAVAGGARGAAPSDVLTVAAPPVELNAEEQAALTGPARTRCTTIVHVGDSTSIGMFSAAQLPYPGDGAVTAYEGVGANAVLPSVVGARATVEGFQGGPSAADSVDQLVAQGVPEGACWVIAVGVNDAANRAVGHPGEELWRIEQILDRIPEGDPVIWSTAVTNRDYGPYANANMEPFNDALREALEEHPQLHLYDWAADARPEWFLQGDEVHYSPQGNLMRALLFAEAVARLLPEDGDGPADRVFRAGPARAAELAAGDDEDAEDAGDADGDGIPDNAGAGAAADADGDGIPDEAGTGSVTDADSDGIPDTAGPGAAAGGGAGPAAGGGAGAAGSAGGY